jgi:type I restriction enzyme M protein
MHWIAPSEKDAASDALEKQLWDAADNFRANSGLTAQQYSGPILGLIFLRFAEARFAVRRTALDKSAAKGGNGHSPRRGSQVDDPTAYHAEGVLFLTPNARYDRLLSLPEGADVGKAVNDAMADVEKHNPQLAGVLPRTYQLFASTLLKELLKTLSKIPLALDYDTFGKIYEYFLGEFARTEGQKGGEFYTPTAIVRLIVEILEPFHGLILDPACGSGGMFVQSARFVSEHQKNPSAEISVHGVEKTDETGRLCRMNLAVHGLEGNIRHGGQINSYYDDPHKATGRFDFVLANPPFNVNAVDKERLAADIGPNRRFPFGLPRSDNANYLWIQLFYSALNTKGRAGFVMANSAADARSSEQEIRKQLIQARGVDVIVAVGPNLFYTVTLPCTLWFFDKSKAGRAALPRSPKSGTSGNSSLPDRADTVLFIDARHIYRQIDRAHRDWTPAQIDFLGNLVRLYRGEEPDFTLGGDEARAKIEEIFGGASSASPKSKALNSPRYRDVPGLCKVTTLAEIEAQGWSLNPGRYVGVAPGEEVSDEDFKEQLETLNEELETLNAQARDLEQTIAGNVAEILEA